MTKTDSPSAHRGRSTVEAAVSPARLKVLATAMVWALRDGRLVRLPSTELVCGDLVRIEAGDHVPTEGTPLERRPEGIGRQIAWVILALGVVLIVGGVFV